MLESVSSLNSQLKTLPETTSILVAATNLISIVATFANAVQAGSEGTTGIFLYNNATAIPLIAALPPVKDNSWIINFADAIEAGVIAGAITPGTVTDPAWAGGSETDTSTSPTTSSTITTLASAKATFISDLASVTYGNNPPMPLAQALHNYISAFTFLCIGTNSSSSPVPLSFPAQ